MVGGEQEKLTFEKFPHLGLFLLPPIFLNFVIKHMIFSTMEDTQRDELNIYSTQNISRIKSKSDFSALVRTYCYDTTVADSACSATSYLCGVELKH